MDAEDTSKITLLETFNRIKLRQLNELRKENEFCDLILKSEDGFEIKVHRVVVSSASNYFKDLLTTPMKEKFEESILLPGITADILEKIITFIYTSKFEEKFENIEHIIKYAVIFQLDQLLEICLLTLNKSINDRTCVQYWRLGRVNLIYALEDKCLAYIASKADHLFKTSLMRDLTIEEMRSLLGDKRLHQQCDEKMIFEYVWKWAESKITETKSFSQVFLEVITLLQFSKLDKEFVYQKMFEKEDVLANTELLNKVAKLTKPKYTDEVPRCLVFKKSTQRRLLSLINKMFIDFGEESTIEKGIDLQIGFSYTTFDNKLFICGGEDSNSCEFFEPSTQQWKQFPSMKTQRWKHQCSYLDSKIYACGGIDKNSIEIFDLGKGEWYYGPAMLADNYDFGLTGVNGALYAIGGQIGNVESLDPRQEQKWNVVYNDFQRDHKYVRCVSIGPCIYCFTYFKRYIFDTRSNKFSEEICCKDFNNDSNFCELDGYIYGFGYQIDSDNKYSLNLIQYHLDGKQGFKNSYGLYNYEEIEQTCIVSLYY